MSLHVIYCVFFSRAPLTEVGNLPLKTPAGEGSFFTQGPIK